MHKKGFKKLKNKVIPLVALYVAVTGGSAFGCEFPGLVGVIKEYKTMSIQVQKEKEELKSKELDNSLKVIELINKSKEVGIDTDKVLDDLQVLDDLGSSLQFKSNEEFSKSEVDE